MAMPRRIDQPYARRASLTRSRQEDDHVFDEGEHQLDLEEVTVITAPPPSRFHVFANLARAVRTRVSYMWGSFCQIITPGSRSPDPTRANCSTYASGYYSRPAKQRMGTTQ